eukprot:1110386-Pyramimonas_sp.AAC.1
MAVTVHQQGFFLVLPIYDGYSSVGGAPVETWSFHCLPSSSLTRRGRLERRRWVNGAVDVPGEGLAGISSNQ